MKRTLSNFKWPTGGDGKDEDSDEDFTDEDSEESMDTESVSDEDVDMETLLKPLLKHQLSSLTDSLSNLSIKKYSRPLQERLARLEQITGAGMLLMIRILHLEDTNQEALVNFVELIIRSLYTLITESMDPN